MVDQLRILSLIEQKYYDFLRKGINYKKVEYLSDEKLKLHKQIIEIFPIYYMTLMSIIQATALSYIVFSMKSNIFDCMFDGDLNTIALNFNPISLLMFVNSVLIIICVWSEYMIGFFTYRWLPSLSDSFFPFFLGFSEYMFIFSMDHKSPFSWYISVAFTCFVGLFSYLNRYSKAFINYDVNKIALESSGNMIFFNPLFMLLFGSCAIIFAAIERYYGGYSIYTLGDMIISLGLIMALIWKGTIQWKRLLS
jgi:hypothetical protein